MKLWRYLKNTAKNALRGLLASLLAVSLLSCSIPHTYSRKEINQAIKKICKEELKLEVGAWTVGDTVWVYAPFEGILGEDKQLKQSVVKAMRGIFLSLRRVILSIDKPPEFYALIFSGIKEAGLDFYRIGFIPDLVKFEMGFISLKEMREREIFITLSNPQALGDREGAHLSKYALTLEEFTAYLVKQAMQRSFTAPGLKDNFRLKEISARYAKDKLTVTFNLMIKKYREGLPEPFTEAKKIIKKFIRIYKPDFKEIELRDTFRKKGVLYTRETLLQEN